MNIIIVGAGEVGRSIAMTLSAEGHNVNLVEQDPEKAKRVDDELDVRVICGNGARPQVLWEAGIRGEECAVDILVACTNRDEANILSCWIARNAGVKHVIARARGLEFTDSPNWGQKLGIDMMLSPERSVAKEIMELISVSSAIRTAELLDGRAAIYAFQVAEDSPLAGKSLKTIRSDHKNLAAIVVCVDRADGDSLIPDGDTVILPQDICYVISRKRDVGILEDLFRRKKRSKLRKVFLVGGGKIAYQLVQKIQRESERVEIRLFDHDLQRVEALSAELGNKRTIVVAADGADRDKLLEEGIEGAVYVCVTDSDEVNLIYAALAKSFGARKTIAVVRRKLYQDMTKHMPVDAIVDPNEALSSTILRTIRYPGHARALSILESENIDAEMLEVVLENSAMADKTLAELGLPKGVLVALLGREGSVSVPDGATKLQMGDHLILFALSELMREAAEMFGVAAQ